MAVYPMTICPRMKALPIMASHCVEAGMALAVVSSRWLYEADLIPTFMAILTDMGKRGLYSILVTVRLG